MSEFEPFSHRGYCHCCRAEVTFASADPWLRDHYLCSGCGSIPRQRHLQFVLDRYFPGWERARLHESSPSNDYLGRWSRQYSLSHFLEGVAPGAERGGVRCEDLERLTFPDGSFDIFVTQDVLEHIFDPAAALREVARVLAPGGIHLFTAPRHRAQVTSSARAVRRAGVVEHVQPPMYHDNPVDPRGSLVTWDYGQDFEHRVQEWTGCPIHTFLMLDRSRGIDGEYLDVFAMEKPGCSRRESVVTRSLSQVASRLGFGPACRW